MMLLNTATKIMKGNKMSFDHMSSFFPEKYSETFNSPSPGTIWNLTTTNQLTEHFE